MKLFLRNLLFGFILINFILGCNGTEEKRIIMTVSGPIGASQMGICLTHEHVLVDFIGADSTGYHRWERNRVVDKVLPYLFEIKQFGVKTFFECTPAYLGRDPLLLKMLSHRSGLNIVTNTSFYGARKNKFIPKFAFDLTPEQLAEIWISEFEYGIEDTNVKPGFIKISVDKNSELSEMHQKIVRAAALTHLKTGLTIASHTGSEQAAMKQIALLRKENVHPSAFIWIHSQTGSKSAHVQLAQSGAWISFDNVRFKKIDQYVEFLQHMKQNGLLNRVLISHDAGWYRVGEPEGGEYRGYTDVFDYFIPALKNIGFTKDEIHKLLVINPQLAFGIRKKPL